MMNEQVFWSPGVTLEMIEKQVIQKAFHFYRGNKTQCSISLGISIRTLENKLDRYREDDQGRQNAEQKEAEDREYHLKRARGIIPGSASEPGGPRVYGSSSGVQVQPSFEAPEKNAVPVSEPEEVQDVLPAKASPGYKVRRRRDDRSADGAA